MKINEDKSKSMKLTEARYDMYDMYLGQMFLSNQPLTWRNLTTQYSPLNTQNHDKS